MSLNYGKGSTVSTMIVSAKFDPKIVVSMYE